jgi:endo-1,4-beta-xylanase
MSEDRTIQRRSVLFGAAAVAATGLVGGARPAAAAESSSSLAPSPLWRVGYDRGIVFGSSWSTRLSSDRAYSALIDRDASILFSEDDLLWYKLKPYPDAKLDFTHGDRFYGHAERDDQLVLACHLVWDEGFGPGWTDKDLWGLNRRQASDLLYGVVKAEVKHYHGRTTAWIVANEVTDPEGVNGFRTNVPWYNTIGPDYVAEAFHITHDQDPKAELILNEFGFETVNQYGDQPGPRQKALLQVLDTLLAQGVPVHAVGVQAHLLADRFPERFNPTNYRRFLREIADRGVHVLITEMDVLDDGLPADPRIRDRAVADVYKRYLEAALDATVVKALLTFGLSDRYTWLQEDYPRHDGAHRRPLPYDVHLHRKPAYWALRNALAGAPARRPLWKPPRA